jgi:hypothetical protein
MADRNLKARHATRPRRTVGCLENFTCEGCNYKPKLGPHLTASLSGDIECIHVLIHPFVRWAAGYHTSEGVAAQLTGSKYLAAPPHPADRNSKTASSRIMSRHATATFKALLEETGRLRHWYSHGTDVRFAMQTYTNIA